MDKIIIKNLKLRVNIGLLDKERKKKQKVILDCELVKDLTKAGKSDSIKDTINYSLVCKTIKDHANKEYKTLEALAHNLAVIIKEQFRPNQVRLYIRKPKALRQYKTKYAAVEVVR